MRRITKVTILVLTILLLLPAAGASADGHCPSISGKGFFDFGRTSTGKANVVYDGDRMLVPFQAFDFVEHDGHGDIFFVWHFPQGDVVIVEHADDFTTLGGPVGTFNTNLDVTEGGSGEWNWSGTANGAGGHAVIKSISGTLCIDSG